MAEICPVCGEEINSENREVYKTSNDSAGIPLHDNCLTKYVSKPEKYGRKKSDAVKLLKATNQPTSANPYDEYLKLQKEINDKSVYVKGFSMPFVEMVRFMVKWALASIPAFIILFIIGAILGAIFVALFF
jgi:hypothetical protein